MIFLSTMEVRSYLVQSEELKELARQREENRSERMALDVRQVLHEERVAREQEKDGLDSQLRAFQSNLPAEMAERYQSMAISAETGLRNSRAEALTELIDDVGRTCEVVRQAIAGDTLEVAEFEALLTEVRGVLEELDPAFTIKENETIAGTAVWLKDQVVAEREKFLNAMPDGLRDLDSEAFAAISHDLDRAVRELFASTDGKEQRRLRVLVGGKLVALRSVAISSATTVVDAAKRLVDERPR